MDPMNEFSLTRGGLLFRLWRRLGLIDDDMGRLKRRVVVASLICWLPLLVLAAMQGRLFGGTAMPFLMDVEAHVRYLIAVPILLAIEVVAHRRLITFEALFVERDLIPPPALRRFQDAIASASRLRDSPWPEAVLMVLVYLVGILFVWRNYAALDLDTWYGRPSPDGHRLTVAGFWYAFVSVPIFQFLVVRSYFRMFIWARLLWQISRIELRLVPSHPDRVGGLGFLSNTINAFIPFMVAHGVMLAGGFAARILHLGASLMDFRLEVAAALVILLALVLCPFLVFAPQLEIAKRKGLQEYGTLAQTYVRDFEAKWLRGAPLGRDAMFQNGGDIQSLADLGNSVQVVDTMRLAPFKSDAVFRLGVAMLAPLSPLLLTMMSVEELMKRLVGILF